MSDARAFPGRPGRPAKYALGDRHIDSDNERDRDTRKHAETTS